MTHDVQREPSLADLSADARARLDQSRIFFAHQSVGQNIVEGLSALQKEDRAAGPAIVDVKNTAASSGPFFAHARLGRNGDPKSKTDAFVAAMESGLGDRVDVAFQKYCYVDIDAHTDVPQVFAYYRQAMARLRERFPKTVLVHVTTPLMVVQSGPKAIIKKWLGRMPDHYADNIARERYNDLLRREFGGREPVFDLAALEASAAGHAPAPVRFREQPVYALLPESSTDGGHLNDAAQRRVATALIVLLGQVARPGSPHSTSVTP
jgi:hypothetical protein